MGTLTLREKKIRGGIRTAFSWCWNERFPKTSERTLRGVVYNCFDSCMLYYALYELNCMKPISNYVLFREF